MLFYIFHLKVKVWHCILIIGVVLFYFYSQRQDEKAVRKGIQQEMIAELQRCLEHNKKVFDDLKVSVEKRVKIVIELYKKSPYNVLQSFIIASRNVRQQTENDYKKKQQEIEDREKYYAEKYKDRVNELNNNKFFFNPTYTYDCFMTIEEQNELYALKIEKAEIEKGIPTLIQTEQIANKMYCYFEEYYEEDAELMDSLKLLEQAFATQV